MLHPERYEKTETVLTLTPSGETEFVTAQPAGSTGASLTDVDVDTTGQVAPAQASEELWDDSFKPPSTLQRSNSPTSTLADRFASAGAALGGYILTLSSLFKGAPGQRLLACSACQIGCSWRLQC